MNDNWVLGAGAVALLFLVMTLSGLARLYDVAADCDTQQSFRVDERVYDCKARSRT